MNAVVGLDIGGTNLRIGLVRRGILERGRAIPTRDLLAEGDEVSRLGELIAAFRGTDEIDAVSIGFPSPISADGKTVRNAPNLIRADGSRAFSGRNLADPLRDMLGVKVLLSNDVNHLLCYDVHTSGAKGILVGCYVGTGFGAAAMIDGRLLQGRHGSAMEAGHIPFYRGDRLCGCGKTGCAECYASGRAAKEMLEAHYPDLSFAEVFRDHAHDAPVVGLVEAIAVTAAALVNLFDPHTLFLGGGVLSEVFPREQLKTAILRHTMAPYPREDLDMRFCNHDAFAGVIGAALATEILG